MAAKRDAEESATAQNETISEEAAVQEEEVIDDIEEPTKEQVKYEVD